MMEKEKCYRRDQEGGGGSLLAGQKKEVFLEMRFIKEKVPCKGSTFLGKGRSSPNLMELEQLGDVYGS